jgi:hypothetical protein
MDSRRLLAAFLVASVFLPGGAAYAASPEPDCVAAKVMMCEQYQGKKIITCVRSAPVIPGQQTPPCCLEYRCEPPYNEPEEDVPSPRNRK